MDAYFDDEDDEEEAMGLVGGGGRDGSKGSRPYTGRAGGSGGRSAVVTSSGVSGDTVKMRPNAAGGARREEYQLQVRVPKVPRTYDVRTGERRGSQISQLLRTNSADRLREMRTKEREA